MYWAGTNAAKRLLWNANGSRRTMACMDAAVRQAASRSSA
jgi:hypothetical protein